MISLRSMYLRKTGLRSVFTGKWDCARSSRRSMRIWARWSTACFISVRNRRKRFRQQGNDWLFFAGLFCSVLFFLKHICIYGIVLKELSSEMGFVLYESVRRVEYQAGLFLFVYHLVLDRSYRSMENGVLCDRGYSWTV